MKQQEARPAPCVRISGGLDGTERAVRCAVGRCASWDNLGSWENLRPPTGSRKRADGGGARVDVVARGREAVNGNRGLARTSSTPFVHREPTRGRWRLALCGGAPAGVHPRSQPAQPARMSPVVVGKIPIPVCAQRRTPRGTSADAASDGDRRGSKKRSNTRSSAPLCFQRHSRDQKSRSKWKINKNGSAARDGWVYNFRSSVRADCCCPLLPSEKECLWISLRGYFTSPRTAGTE